MSRSGPCGLAACARPWGHRRRPRSAACWPHSAQTCSRYVRISLGGSPNPVSSPGVHARDSPFPVLTPRPFQIHWQQLDLCPRRAWPLPISGYWQGSCPETAHHHTQGPFNHDARQEVGLPRDYYDVTLWPSADREGLSQARPPIADPSIAVPPLAMNAGQLQALRDRLQMVVDQEVQASDLSPA